MQLQLNPNATSVHIKCNCWIWDILSTACRPKISTKKASTLTFQLFRIARNCKQIARTFSWCDAWCIDKIDVLLWTERRKRRRLQISTNSKILYFATLCSINVYWCGSAVGCRSSVLFCCWRYYYVKCIKSFDSCSLLLYQNRLANMPNIIESTVLSPTIIARRLHSQRSPREQCNKDTKIPMCS